MAQQHTAKVPHLLAQSFDVIVSRSCFAVLYSSAWMPACCGAFQIECIAKHKLRQSTLENPLRRVAA